MHNKNICAYMYTCGNGKLLHDRPRKWIVVIFRIKRQMFLSIAKKRAQWKKCNYVYVSALRAATRYALRLSAIATPLNLAFADESTQFVVKGQTKKILINFRFKFTGGPFLHFNYKIIAYIWAQRSAVEQFFVSFHSFYLKRPGWGVCVYVYTYISCYTHKSC